MKLVKIKSIRGLECGSIEVKAWFKIAAKHLLKFKNSSASNNINIRDDGSVDGTFIYTPQQFMENFYIYYTRTKTKKTKNTQKQ